MEWPHPKIVLWTGAKHSGKTSMATRLADQAAGEGFTVAGILAPAVYQNGALAGYDVINIRTGRRLPLVECAEDEADVGFFTFLPEGLELGDDAISSAATNSDQVVIIDEFGQLELDGRGWRAVVDKMTIEFSGVMLLVVRQMWARDVASLYDQWHPERIPATEPYAIDRMLQLLRLGNQQAVAEE